MKVYKSLTGLPDELYNDEAQELLFCGKFPTAEIEVLQFELDYLQGQVRDGLVSVGGMLSVDWQMLDVRVRTTTSTGHSCQPLPRIPYDPWLWIGPTTGYWIGPTGWATGHWLLAGKIELAVL